MSYAHSLPCGGSPADTPAGAFEGHLAQQAVQLLDEVRGAIGHDLDAARSSLARLARLLGKTPPVNPARGGLAPWQARKVTAMIDDNIDATLPVDRLATAAALSPSHFCRAFKDSFGEPPHAYVMGRRVARAKALMLETAEPLSQIALACGFADQAHLSKLFRVRTGETPSAWRRANRVPAPEDALKSF